MYGAILGDIIGSRFEFDRGAKTKKFELFHKECGFTDDTVMTLAVAEALLSIFQDATEKEICDSFIYSMRKWGRKYPYAGYGGRFIYWIFDENPKPYGSFGNGSAMRVSSVGWLYDTLEKTREMAELSAKVTHNHPEGIKGAQACASVIFLARSGKSKEEIRNYVIKEFQYDLSESMEELRARHKHNESCQDTLPKALISFFLGTSFEDVIRNAVSLGGDTDTIAAIAGSMAEAFYGVPKRMKEICESYLPNEMLKVLFEFNKKVND